ncbi:MAG: cysteine desulfurase, partial [Erysipelotrichaceae bacterium]|nr:cysteine desulfurase [Erysipelotrichaceae bacterium]
LKTYRDVLQKYYVNSESIYPDGLAVNKLMDRSRQQMADLLRVRSNEIIFTSGGSEANNLAIKGYALKNSEKGKHIITSSIEHSSVLNSCRWLQEYAGFEVTYLPVGQDGKIILSELEKAIRDDTILVSIMYVNNESGAIQPINGIKKLTHQHHCALHCDCVQALGKLPIDLQDIEMASFSAHKIYGLKGSGFLVRKQHVSLAPVISGGQQEQGLRGGTANAPANMVLGKTMRLALENLEEKERLVREYRDHVRREVEKMDGMVINSPQDASPYVLNFSCLKIPSEVMMNALAMKGYAVSAQSTCDSASAVSHVISQMFTEPDRLKGTIRVSFSHLQTRQDIEGFVTDLKEVLDKYG